MIPFYKAFSLFIRVLSKPVLNHVKRVHSAGQTKSSKVKPFFIYLGNFYHRYDSMINRRFLKIKSHFAHKPLSDELALQKGIQFFYEIILYSIILGFPMYQIWRAQQDSSQKSKEVDQALTKLQQQSNQRLKNIEQVSRQLFGDISLQLK